MNPNPYQQYRQIQMQTASPSELLVMLYDGAIRFVMLAEAAVSERDIDGAHTAILRAQAIIEELMAGLKQSEAAFGDKLMSLYAYMHRRLVEANVRKDVGRLQEVRGLLESLREAWREAVRVAGSQTTESSGAQTALSAHS